MASIEDPMSGDEIDEEKGFEDLRNIDVVTKYRLASDIVNQALALVMGECKAGALVVDLCEKGDKYILDATAKIYKGKKVQKGIGFPTCISLNNTVGAFSPMPGDSTALATGDLIKVDLGCQIDGYVSQVAHTFIVGAPAETITDRRADLLHAISTASQCVQRLIKPGVKNTKITDVVEKVAQQFGVKTVEGVFSHQVKRFEIDAEKKVANNKPEVPLTGENKTKEITFEPHETWALDIVMSTGAGKPQQLDERQTTVFKRVPERVYKLKLKASRAVLSEVTTRFPVFPFGMRAMEFDEGKRRFGVIDCVRHELLEAYPVLQERDGEFVAHLKFTCLLLPNGTMKVTGLPVDVSNLQAAVQITDPELLEVLAMPLPKKAGSKKNKKKKKKKTSAAAATSSA